MKVVFSSATAATLGVPRLRQVASLSDRASEAVRTALLITHDVVQMVALEIRAEGLDALFAVRGELV